MKFVSSEDEKNIVYNYVLDWQPPVEGCLLNISTFCEMKPRDVEFYIDELLEEKKITTTYINSVYCYSKTW